MEISKAKELACEIAGLLTVLHENLCPDGCSDNLMREAEEKAVRLAQILTYKAEANNIVDGMNANAESEIIEKEEAEAEENAIDETAEEQVEEPEEMPIEITPEETLQEPVEESPETIADEIEEDIADDASSGDTATDLNESVFMRTKVNSISKAFTINDKFRFKRELFGNSDPEFSNALDLISVMRSIDETEDYFYNELGWDVENEDVKDFMRIVRAYFLNRQ